MCFEKKKKKASFPNFGVRVRFCFSAFGNDKRAKGKVPIESSMKRRGTGRIYHSSFYILSITDMNSVAFPICYLCTEKVSFAP